MITGAMGGPCSGHLFVSHVPLMVESPVGQLNSLPLISQTGAKFPADGRKRQLWLVSRAGQEWGGGSISVQATSTGAIRAPKLFLPVSSVGPSIHSFSS